MGGGIFHLVAGGTPMLTEKAVQAAKAAGKPEKLFDGGGCTFWLSLKAHDFGD